MDERSLLVQRVEKKLKQRSLARIVLGLGLGCIALGIVVNKGYHTKIYKVKKAQDFVGEERVYYQLPWPPYTRVELPKDGPFMAKKAPFRFGVRNLSEAVSLCTEFDDDTKFPRTECDCADLDAECKGLMPRHEIYYARCFESACGNSHKVEHDRLCNGEKVGPSWGNPCAWQMIKNLPETCQNDFIPKPPTQASRNIPNKYPTLNHDQREVEGLMEDFLGSCNVHSFCLTCLENDETSLNPYCAAIYQHYGGTPTASSFFDDLDFWCQPQILHALKSSSTSQHPATLFF